GQQDAGHVEIHPQPVIDPTCRYRRDEMVMSAEINSSNSAKTLSWTRVPIYMRFHAAPCAASIPLKALQ
ncbi:MAG TPA: hypothetical protein VG225_11865, partial [Terracidiphilus sp.]|nr:hypothetical protein [Terracidiphilus sp.]